MQLTRLLSILLLTAGCGDLESPGPVANEGGVPTSATNATPGSVEDVGGTYAGGGDDSSASTETPTNPEASHEAVDAMMEAASTTGGEASEASLNVVAEAEEVTADEPAAEAPEEEIVDSQEPGDEIVDSEEPESETLTGGVQTGDEGSKAPFVCTATMPTTVEDLDEALPEREVSARELIDELSGTLAGLFTTVEDEQEFPSTLEVRYVEGSAGLVAFEDLEERVELECEAPSLVADFEVHLSIPGVVTGSLQVDYVWGTSEGATGGTGKVAAAGMSIESEPPALSDRLPEGTEFAVGLAIVPEGDAFGGTLFWRGESPEGGSTQRHWGYFHLARP